MASVSKFTDKAVFNQLRHCNRTIQKNRNTDIDPTRTELNYSLTPHRGISEFEYYKQRKSELYCYGRSDVKTMCGWVVTAPKELSSKAEERVFFEKTYQFLEDRYGKENVISATVHYDEGKTEKLKDRWGQPIKDENGEVKKELVLGRPHLHFCFIPVVPDKKSNHPQTEKISANAVLTPIELQHFHTDLANATQCPYVINGSTKANGKNYTVEELKERYETEKELKRLRDIEKKYNLEHDRTRWR